MLQGDRDTRHFTEMPKRPKPAIQTPEPPSDLKRTRSLKSVSKGTTCSPPDRTPGKNPYSGQRKGAGKLEKGLAQKGILQYKEDVVASPVVQRDSSRGAGSSHKYSGDGGVQEACSAQRAPNNNSLTTKYSEMSISESAVIPISKDADMSPLGKIRANEVTDDPGAADISEVVKDDPGGLEPLAVDLMDGILGRLPMTEVVQLQPYLGKALRNAVHRPAFCHNRPISEAEYSPVYFMTDAKGDLHWNGYDTKLRKWTRLPSLNFAPNILPAPDPDLFKDYLMAGDGGLLCINVGKATGREKLVICNPLTRMAKVLPPLIHGRHPVLMHLKVDNQSGHYQVIVAGSAVSGTEEVSSKTEVYNSGTGMWECPDGSDLPCPHFGLNEYQNGAYLNSGDRELLMCVAIVDTRGRGVLVYDIKKKRWTQGPHVKQLHIPLVRSDVPNIAHLSTTQIVECGGSVYVFSEQECGRDVYFVIHKLIPDVPEGFTWDVVMKRKRTGGRGLLVYPEFTCVPVSEHELGIFNTVEQTLEIIDLASPTEATPLQYATEVTPLQVFRFHTLNPIGYVFKPSFTSVVAPRGQTQYKRQSKIETVPEQVSQNQKMEPESDKSQPQADEASDRNSLFNDDSDVSYSNGVVDIDSDDFPEEFEGDSDAMNVSDAIPVSADSTSVQNPDRRRRPGCTNESDTQPRTMKEYNNTWRSISAK